MGFAGLKTMSFQFHVNYSRMSGSSSSVLGDGRYKCISLYQKESVLVVWASEQDAS